MLLNRRNILIASALLEGGLIATYFIWASLSGTPIRLEFEFRGLAYGLLGSLPIFAFSWIFFGNHSESLGLLRSCFEFKEEVIKPLSDCLDVTAAAVVSALAGFGEEVFFRGLVQHYSGVIATGILFSVMHFGLAIRFHLFIAFLYSLIGIYLGWLYLVSGSLWAPIIAHSVYDFVAISYMRDGYRSPRAAN